LRLCASANVIVKAEEVMRQIVETYSLPNMDFVISKTGRSTTPMCFGRSVKLAVRTCTFRWWAIGQVFLEDSLLEGVQHGYRRNKNWRELCHAALEAKDSNELLEIVQELNKALKHEEQVLVISGRLQGRSSPPVKSAVNNYREGPRRADISTDLCVSEHQHLGLSTPAPKVLLSNTSCFQQIRTAIPARHLGIMVAFLWLKSAVGSRTQVGRKQFVLTGT